VTTVFQRVGPFEIVSQIGEGGMGLVFLAEDSRTGQRVALKLVPHRDNEVVEAERVGVLLQSQLSDVCPYVPKVFEYGDLVPNYFCISMEFVEGENLSDLIAPGPLDSARAVALVAQLCRFLHAAHNFDQEVDGRQMRALVHGDLKPRNVRVSSGGEVKILDFGIAKGLSLSRKVTRNDFGSLPYMSPERLDSADSDVDPSVDLWALGVIFYELLSGTAPFKAADTRRLEIQIRNGVPRQPLPAAVPEGLRAISARLLAPDREARYQAAEAVLADLDRFTRGETTEAEGAGFPGRAADDATRRTRREADEATRRTTKAEAPTVQTARGPVVPSAAAPPAPRAPWKPTFRGVLLVLAILMVVNEATVRLSARRPAALAATADQERLAELWGTHDSLAGRSMLRFGVLGLEHALQTRAMELADQVIANYRGPVPTVRERQWSLAQKNLQNALAVAPSDRRLKATLRYCEGHLYRIDGEAEKSRGRHERANRFFADAVVAFRQAAELRRDWPDPFLGLARTFIYGLDDMDRAADALKQAQERGYDMGDREVAQLGDGYRVRGERLRATARQMRGMPQEEEYLRRALAAYREALEQYERIPEFNGTAGNLQRVQRAADEIESRLELMALGRIFDPQ
jgi:hypothetical protein